MTTLFLDSETFSETPIAAGTHRYAENAEVMIITYAVDDGPVETIDLTEPGMKTTCQLEEFEALFRRADKLVAHNVAFDRTLLRAVLGLDRPIEVWHCTMTRALMHSLPGSLDTLSDIYNLKKTAMEKIKDGKKLIHLFCKPRSVKAKVRRATRETHPMDWKRFLKYAAQDVEAMRALYKQLPTWNWTQAEREAWWLNMTINERGMLIDQTLAEQAIATIQREVEQYRWRQREIHPASPEVTQRDALLHYLLEQCGVEMPNMQGSTIEKKLDDPDLPEPVKELLRIRLGVCQTSNAKWPKLLKSVSSDGRLRGTSQFCGAGRTGRDSGRLFQPLNLPRPPKYLKTREAMREAVDFMRTGVADLVYKNATEVASACLRGAVIAPPGRKLLVADLNAIEGRVAAWVAGEQWKLDAYAAGEDLYVVTYARSFHVDQAAVEDSQRQVGKVMELALGFGGAVGAFGTMGRLYGVEMDEAEILALVRAWRKANSKIVACWYDCENAAKALCTMTDAVIPVGPVKFMRQGSWLRVLLPSGRSLSYPAPRVDEDGQFSYMGVNQYTRKWERIRSYGGKLFENIVQAIARDVLYDGMKRVEAEGGHDIILTIYDEVVAEVPDADEFDWICLADILATTPTWAPGLPLKAAGFETDRYMKG